MVNNILRKNAELSKEKQNLLNKVEKEIKGAKKLILKHKEYETELKKQLKNITNMKNRNQTSYQMKQIITKKLKNNFNQIIHLLENLLKLTDLKRNIMKNMNKPFQNFISVHFRNTSINGNRR
tara:strand:+ start:569 stop:937 length:369 start_codon:yes stop_codon:yes gene_type:complete